MADATPTPIEALAELVAPPGRYGFDGLVRGLDLERRRLGTKPFLTVLCVSELDHDGFSDWIRLGASFADADEAIAHADRWLSSERDNHLEAARADWSIEPEGGLSPTLPPGQGVDVHYKNSVGLAGGLYDHVYLCARVLGPFRGPIVDRPLLEFFAAAIDELRAYLLDAAGWDHRHE